MDDNLNHIDKFFKDSLENYIPESRKKFAWGKLGLKLLIFNLGGWSLFAASVIFVGVTITVVYNVAEIAEVINPSITEKPKNNTLDKPTNVESFESPNINPMEMRNQELSEAPGGNIEGYENQENLEKGEQLSKPQQNKNILHETFSDLNESDNYSTKQTSNKTNKAYSAFLLRPLALSFNDISISQIKFDDHHHLVKITPETKFADSLENIGIKTRKVSLELFINPAFVFGKSTGTEFTEDHISNRNKNESPILTLGFGSDIKYHFSNWFIQTGLNFSQYGEKANYQLNRQVSDPDNLVSSIDTTFRWIYDPPNIGELWIVSIDTNWVPGQKTVYWEQKSTNRISYIEIPVLAGYQWNFDKINIDVSTGISLGFAISKTGGLPAPTNSELIQLGGINIAEPLINYIFQAGVAIPLRERLTLLIKPNLKYNLNSIYDDEEYTVKQHYNSFGLKVGVIIDL